MQKPNILLHGNHRIAFEEVVRQEAERFVKRSKGKKALDVAKKYLQIVGSPILAGGVIGGISGGLEGSLEGMKQVSVSVVPYTVLLGGLQDLCQRKLPLDNINFVINKTRNEVTNVLRYIESKPQMAFGTALQLALPTGLFYGMSLLSEKITGMDIDQGLVASSGLLLGLVGAGVSQYVGNKWKHKVLDYAESHPVEIEERRGERLELEGLETLVDVALDDPERTHKIDVASSEKRFRGIDGALGFLGALDELADKDRDPTRVRSNVSLSLKSEGWGYGQGYPQFTFKCERGETKTETILKLAQIVNARSNGVGLDIHPIFSDAPLEEMLSEPYEQLSAVYMRGTQDGSEHFKVQYSFNDYGDKDKVEVIVNSREQLGLVSEVFRQTYGRPIEDTDFDSELVELSQGDHKVHNFKPKKERDQPVFGFPTQKKEKVTPEQPEQPTQDMDSLANLALRVYRQERKNIMPSRGFPSLDIAVEGAVYSLSPMDYNKKGKRLRTALRCIGSPLKTLGNLATEREVLPSLREAEVMAQVSGITRENAYDIIRELGNRVSGIEVDPSMKSVSYNDFWQFRQNPQLLVDNAYDVEVTDDKGTKIKLHFKEPEQSYGTVRSEYFPDNEIVAQRAEEVRDARERKDYDKLGFFGAFGKSRWEKELEEPSYKNVPAQGNSPAHTVIYRGDDHQPFMDNRTVHISTSNMLFLDQPVHPKEGIRRVSRYLSNLRDAVQKVNE